MKPAALTVSVSAAVIAKPQPRGVSPSCLKNNNNEGNIWTGQEQHPLLVYITPALLSAVNSQLCSSFSSSSSPFPLYFYACHVTFACAFNPNLPHVFSILSSPPYLHFFFYLPPPLCLTFSFSLPPSPRLSCYLAAKLPLPTTYLYPGSAANN